MTAAKVAEGRQNRSVASLRTTASATRLRAVKAQNRTAHNLRLSGRDGVGLTRMTPNDTGECHLFERWRPRNMGPIGPYYYYLTL